MSSGTGPPPKVTAAGGPLQILLTEDNPGDASLIRQALSVVDDAHELRHVATLAESLAALSERRYNVALVDLSLPDSTGLETIRSIRAHAPHVPIVILTGSDDEVLAVACIDAGAQDVVSKDALRGLTLRRVIGYARAREREEQIAVLEHTLDHYRALSSAGATTGVTRSLAGASSIRERARPVFRALVLEYSRLLAIYLDSLVVKTARPRNGMESLITTLGIEGGGPRDLVDVHVASVSESMGDELSTRATAYTVEGRLFALEMMGLLVDYYRVGVRRSADKED